MGIKRIFVVLTILLFYLPINTNAQGRKKIAKSIVEFGKTHHIRNNTLSSSLKRQRMQHFLLNQKVGNSTFSLAQGLTPAVFNHILPTPAPPIYSSALLSVPDSRLAFHRRFYDYSNSEPLPSSKPSLSPELIKPVFEALLSSFKADSSIGGTWCLIGWADNIQLPNLIEFVDKSDRYIHIPEDFEIYNMSVEYDNKPDVMSSYDNEVPKLTRIEDNIMALDICSRRLILKRIPTSIDHTVGLERALYQMPEKTRAMTLSVPQRLVKKDIQSQYPNDLESKANATNNELSEPISTPIKGNKWFNIGKNIEEQMIKLGIQIQFDFEMEKDTVGFIIYTYGYEYKPEAA